MRGSKGNTGSSDYSLDEGTFQLHCASKLSAL